MKGYELPEDLLVSFASEPNQYTNPEGYGRAREKRDEIFRRSTMYPREFETKGKGTPHPYLVPLPNWSSGRTYGSRSHAGKSVDDITNKITELQTTPDPVTKGSAAISDDIVEKITEVQTTPDPVTDAFLSRRQLLFPRKKNTGGLVGLYY